MKHVKLITLLLAAGLTACSSDDGTETPPAPRRMTVEVTENPFIDSETGSRISLSPLRRAAQTTTETLKAFRMNYTTDFQYDFTKNPNTGNWEPPTTDPNSVEYSWPSNVLDDTSIDFYAHTQNDGVTFKYTNGEPYITFNVDEDASEQHDLLVAHTKTSYTDAKGKVCFTFDHACAAVLFNFGQSRALYDENVTFTKIALVGVYNQGDCFYKYVDNELKPTWNNLSGADKSIYTLKETTDIVIPYSTKEHVGACPLKGCGYLFMIPKH